MSSSSRPKDTVGKFVLIALLPSGFSAVVCLLTGVGIVLLHVLFISLNIGTFLPTLFDGQWAVSYTAGVVQPLQRLFQNNGFNQFLTIVLWSVVGFLAYELGDHIRRLYREFRSAEHEVQVADGRVVRHPLLRSFVTRAAWRAGLGVVLIIVLVALGPVFDSLFAADYQLFDGRTELTSGILSLLMNIGIWALLTHGLVVFLRFYSMKARLHH